MTQFNVIWYNFNKQKFEPYDIIPSLVDEYNKQEIKPLTFEEFKNFVLDYSRYQWWARCEYEIILKEWPCGRIHEKWDIYKQVEMNIDVITNTLIKELL